MPCANCDTELTGEYCHACGQHVLDNPDLRLWPFVRVFGRELIDLDFKTVHTLRGLLTPGLLTREFLDGRRRRYLSPLKLYFVAAGIFFLAAPFVGFTVDEMSRQSTGLQELIAARMRERSLDAALFAERFDLRVQTVYTLSLSVSILVMAALLKALFRARTLGMHLVFALHYVSFLYFAAILIAVVEQTANLGDSPLALLLIYAIIAPYQFMALRRVYGQSRLRTAWKVAVVCAVTFLADNLVNYAALLVTLQLI
jgi:hypothetical protein